MIVTAGAKHVGAPGGDDLICLTLGFVHTLDAGAGNDTVIADTGIGSGTELGPGSDRYVGSTGFDEVAGGSERGAPTTSGTSSTPDPAVSTRTPSTRGTGTTSTPTTYAWAGALSTSGAS